MALEFYWRHENNNGRIVGLEHEEFERIQPANDVLANKTGLVIDQYSNGRIAPDHARILLDCLENEDFSHDPALVELQIMLRESAENGWWIYTSGD